MGLEGSVAMITGAGGAIGRAVALRLAADGAAVVAVDVNLEQATRTAEAVEAAGGQAMAAAVDVRQRSEIDAMVEAAIARFGRVDILVNSAGGSARERATLFHESDEEVLDWVLGVNLKGALLCIRSTIGRMIDQGRGRVVNIASIVAVQGKARHVDYAAAKGGLIAMTKALAMEVGVHGVTVNCASPGLVPRTAVDDGFGERNSYVGKVCTPEHVAALVAFLASDEAEMITGQNYIIDGGRSLGLKGD